MNTIRTLGATAAVAAALVIPAVAAAPAHASGGRDGVEASGSCSVRGTWDLKAKTDDGRLEVEFEVDTNVPGQTFTVRVTDGPTVVFAGSKTTGARSGSFSVERRTADRAGVDTIRAVATRGGNTCTGVIKI
ncbi:hypothetical protein ACXR2U_07845 [Jatrophihabitans sp. YIM 134969]